MSRSTCAGLMVLYITALGPSPTACERVGVKEPQLGPGEIPPCPPGVEKNLRSDQARGCWFKAAHGRWRILARNGHYDTVVYHAAADSQADAIEIARMMVSGDGPTIEELLVYVYSEPLLVESARIRRVKWDARLGYVTLDFNGRVPPWVMPVQP